MKFTEFIDNLHSVFGANKYFLVKAVRLALEAVQVDDYIMDILTDTD